MAGFRSEDDFHRYVGGIFVSGFADSELGPKLRGTGVVLCIECPDLDTALVVDLARATVHPPGSGPEADVTLVMNSEIANRYWQGKINPTLAVVTGKVRVRGHAETLIAVQPATRKLTPRYLALLEADRRDDLIIA